MNSIYGLKGLQIKAFEINHADTDSVNAFLSEYDGNIVSVDYSAMALGMTKVIVLYKATED